MLMFNIQAESMQTEQVSMIRSQIPCSERNNTWVVANLTGVEGIQRQGDFRQIIIYGGDNNTQQHDPLN
jgi:hypothetical protein